MDQMIATFTKKLLAEEVFNCTICKKLLTPPIITVKDVGNVCQICFDAHQEDEWVYLVNSNLNAILKELKFPCKYESQGCNTAVGYDNLEDHQKECIYRSTNCLMPQSECEWYGKLQEIPTHFKDEHPKHIVHSPNESFTLEYNFKKSPNFVKLLKNKNKTYIFKIKELQQNMSSALLHFIQDTDPVTEDLDLIINHVGKHGQFKIKSKRLTLGTKDDESNGTKVSLSTLEEIAEASGNISITIKPNKYQLKNISGQILKQLECPVCKDIMRPPIRQCKTGHNICDNCRPKLTDCPTCRQSLGDGRNWALEDITPFILYPCMNNQFGCEGTFLGSDIDLHEGICKFKMYKCPIIGCTFSGYYLTEKNHFETNHSEHLSSSEFSETFVQNYNNTNVETIRYFFENCNIYKLVFTRSRDKCCWIVRILNKCDEREKYFYKVTITNSLMPQKKLMKSALCLNANMEATDSDMIVFTYNDLAAYKNHTSNDQIQYYCKIKNVESSE